MSLPKFFSASRFRWMTLLLGLQAVAYYAYPKGEAIPHFDPLSRLSSQIGSWRMVQDVPIEPEVQALLKADDAINRVYIDAAANSSASLYVAFFKTQSTGISPHSPKVCLPGSGWTPRDSSRMAVQVPGEDSPITVNRYIIQRGEASSVVLYWYQTPHRVVADEYAAKFYTVIDSLRFHRTDTSLVRVICNVDSRGEQAAQDEAVRFTQKIFPTLRQLLPS
ncbi:exosortase C-terminal domain/associated protein EpsI [Paludibaculum fermentans]|uniref:exosortase C-terminal domain/associated protein EpsI n=1 Tax=Paludibaculum fermentans TaxID=1473598 RepID=UPI003EBBD3D4